MAQPLSEANATRELKMNCTVYYTPRESGFAPGRGFDLHLVTRPGLRGRFFPADFLRAVQMEGHGLMVRPQGSFGYIYYNGTWGYTDLPRGTREVPLMPRLSCAVSIDSFPFRKDQWIKLESAAMPHEMASAIWQVVDVGGSVGYHQIDLYWGEDDPKGSGADLYRPAGTAFTGLTQAHVLMSRTLSALVPPPSPARNLEFAAMVTRFNPFFTVNSSTN